MMNKDCYAACVFRVNETSSAHRCECVACPNRCEMQYIVASNKTLTDEELRRKLKEMEGNNDN